MIPVPYALTSAPIAGTTERFPVRRIYCVGRNYAAHAREMGMDERDPPFFFTKFPDTLAESGTTIAYPPATADYQYEGELVIAIGKAASRVVVNDALDHVFGYACGLDMTRRDLQLIARDKGRPWDMGKNFSASAVIAPIQPVSAAGAVEQGRLELRVNDIVRQESGLDLLLWSCAEVIADLSTYDILMPGDLIYTGTPAGVGPVQRGDRIDLTITGLPPLQILIDGAN